MCLTIATLSSNGADCTDFVDSLAIGLYCSSLWVSPIDGAQCPPKSRNVSFCRSANTGVSMNISPGTIVTRVDPYFPRNTQHTLFSLFWTVC